MAATKHKQNKKNLQFLIYGAIKKIFHVFMAIYFTDRINPLIVNTNTLFVSASSLIDASQNIN